MRLIIISNTGKEYAYKGFTQEELMAIAERAVRNRLVNDCKGVRPEGFEIPFTKLVEWVS